jgi:predicted lipoprotein with Yx(FWY)xxD motif
MRERLQSIWLGVGAAAVAGIVGLAIVVSAQGAPGAAARLSVQSSEYGKTVFGPNGKVVYAFGADRGSTSRCYGACAKAWPPVLTTGAPLAGSGVQSSLLGSTKRSDGTMQVTYGGHPLYYYVSDKVGAIMCQHANMHGGLWLIVKPNGQPNMANGTMHMK